MLVFAGTCLLLCAVGSHIGTTSGEKVLLIPNAAYSVHRSLITVGEELQKKGHDVVVYQMEGADKVCPGNNCMRTITYKAPSFNMEERKAQWQELMARVSVANPWTKAFITIQTMSKKQESICQTALGDHSAIQKLSEEKFDFILIDGSIQNACYAVIPYTLNVTYGAYGDIMFTWPGLRPFRPHADPTDYSPCTEHMSIIEMALNTMAMLYQYFAFAYHLPMQYVNELAPELTRIQTMELLFGASIYIVNDYTFLGYADPQSSNVIQVGGIVTRPPKPLRAEFRKFLDKSTQKAVVFAFGGPTFTTVPEEFYAKFVRALTEVNVPILWKDNANVTTGNIMKRPWLPINDVLGHPKAGLLIYHCGRNGFYEAVYHGVPILCFPVMHDQPHYGARVEKLGIGKTLELGTFTSDQLRDTINELLTNASYKANAVRLSKILHSFPQTSSEKAGYWIDHVIKHGVDHLQPTSPPNTVYGVLIVAGLIYVGVHIVVIYCCCCKKKSQTPPKKKGKKD